MYIPFMRVTAVNFDAAGNIWCCNNWKPDFLLDLVGDPRKDEQANPGRGWDGDFRRDGETAGELKSPRGARS